MTSYNYFCWNPVVYTLIDFSSCFKQCKEGCNYGSSEKICVSLSFKWSNVLRRQFLYCVAIVISPSDFFLNWAIWLWFEKKLVRQNMKFYAYAPPPLRFWLRPWQFWRSFSNNKLYPCKHTIPAGTQYICKFARHNIYFFLKFLAWFQNFANFKKLFPPGAYWFPVAA